MNSNIRLEFESPNQGEPPVIITVEQTWKDDPDHGDIKQFHWTASAFGLTGGTIEYPIEDHEPYELGLAWALEQVMQSMLAFITKQQYDTDPHNNEGWGERFVAATVAWGEHDPLAF